jgi:DNA mismatch endonuclease, patch repair protein
MAMAAERPPKPSAERSRNMAAIRHRNTKPEMIVRRMLHRAGFRFRLHRRDLPGTPDLTLKKWNAVIEVQGCFWHAHDCHLFKRPKDNAEFWSEKHGQNFNRDQQNADAIAALGMRRLVIWECALRGRTGLDQTTIQNRVVNWITGTESRGEISGR